jgi:hypothetical protein
MEGASEMPRKFRLVSGLLRCGIGRAVFAAVPGKCQIREMGDLPEKFRTAFRFAEI